MYINLNIFKVFLFTDIDKIHLIITLFFMSFIQVAVGIIKTAVILNSNLESNTSSFCYVPKQRYQTLSINKSKVSKATDNEVIDLKNQLLRHKTEDNHMEQKLINLVAYKIRLPL